MSLSQLNGIDIPDDIFVVFIKNRRVFNMYVMVLVDCLVNNGELNDDEAMRDVLQRVFALPVSEFRGALTLFLKKFNHFKRSLFDDLSQ
jgi:hypothetical protein